MTNSPIPITVEDVLRIHDRVLANTEEFRHVLDPHRVESAVHGMNAGFSGQELYPTIPEKAAFLGYTLGHDHGFAGGNKRTAYQSVELFLLRNGLCLVCDADEAEAMMTKVAAGENQQGQSLHGGLLVGSRAARSLPELAPGGCRSIACDARDCGVGEGKCQVAGGGAGPAGGRARVFCFTVGMDGETAGCGRGLTCIPVGCYNVSEQLNQMTLAALPTPRVSTKELRS